jgi:hypothetical protein
MVQMYICNNSYENIVCFYTVYKFSLQTTLMHLFQTQIWLSKPIVKHMWLVHEIME